MIRALLAFLAALTDLIGGQIQLNFDTPVTLVPHIKSGRLRAVAITGTKRLATLPDVPTFAEAGFPKTESYFFLGLAVPKGTPRPVIDALVAANRKVTTDPAFARERCWTPSPSSRWPRRRRSSPSSW